MTNKPIIRESLNQYLVLVKQLTNQSTNNKMKEEIINLLIKSPENLKAAKAISDNYKIGMKLINLEVFYRLFSCLNELGFDTENSFLEKDERIDTAFIPLKEFILEDGIFELGINIELENNYFFFCVLRKNELRKPNVNTLPKFQEIRDFLHSRVKNLNVVNGWTIGKSNEFTIGLDINDYTEENELNIEALKKLAEKINNFKTLLNS